MGSRASGRIVGGLEQSDSHAAFGKDRSTPMTCLIRWRAPTGLGPFSSGFRRRSREGAPVRPPHPLHRAGRRSQLIKCGGCVRACRREAGGVGFLILRLWAEQGVAQRERTWCRSRFLRMRSNDPIRANEANVGEPEHSGCGDGGVRRVAARSNGRLRFDSLMTTISTRLSPSLMSYTTR